MVHNLTAVYKLVEKVGGLDENLRMVRISSDILPVYTQKDWCYFWLRPDVIAYCEKHFIKVGDLARTLNVRLSFHPGQFTVLASENPGIVERSIEEFEYHTNMARWMGYGKTFQDFKINVHISGKRGPDGIREALKRLSPEARNCITIENDEMSWGVDASLELVNDCALVLDIHHHWIRTGEYIQSNDDRVKRIIDSWRGVRPAMHYSVSREDVLVGHSDNIAPDHAQLLLEGYKKQKLRAHSETYWNIPANEWALSFRNDFDIMCESKAKNLSSFALYQEALRLGL
jgi:UV DNA damage repair endonuclease